MKAVMPWQALLDLVEPHNPKTSKKGGWPPYRMATMLPIYLLQQWYSRSDPAIEEALIEMPTMSCFAGIDLISDHYKVLPGERSPSFNTILEIVSALRLKLNASVRSEGEVT